MTKKETMILDYLQGTVTRYIAGRYLSTYLLNEIENIRSEVLVLYFDRSMTIEDGAIVLNDKDIELTRAYLYHQVGEYEVQVGGGEIQIGCKVFTVNFAKKLVILQKDGVRTDNDTYSVRVKDIEILYKAHELGIIITHNGFTCDAHEVTCEEVEEWIAND